MNAIPILMVRNEERWIRQVLESAVYGFGAALVGDTGSTDDTLKIARSVRGVQVVELGPQSPKELGKVRERLGRMIAAMGAWWAFLIDGDELYYPEALRAIADSAMPEGKLIGFTTLGTVDQDDDGALWEVEAPFNRLAVYPAGNDFVGEYPFEWPDVWGRQDPTLYHYFAVPEGYTYHGWHLHRLQRSRCDAEVYLRQQKQFQYAMQDRQVGRLDRVTLW